MDHAALESKVNGIAGAQAAMMLVLGILLDSHKGDSQIRARLQLAGARSQAQMLASAVPETELESFSQTFEMLLEGLT